MKLFGTDGVRGIPGKPPLTPATIRAIAGSAARLLLARAGRKGNGTAPLVLMGRDTRASGPALCRELVEGFWAAGCKTMDLGVVPTPAVSYLTPRLGAVCGVVVSASHNPANFNGIKFFNGDGFKMDPGMEEEIEEEVAGGAERSRAAWSRAVARAAFGGSRSGTEHKTEYKKEYTDFLKSTFPATMDLVGMRIVVDCANGAASSIAPDFFRSLGAEVFAIGCSPNGRNINAGYGALDTGAMRREVRRRKADCGISFDGDADRALLADEKGALLDGDHLICLAAMRLRRLGLLRGGKVVLTVMSNYGLLSYLAKHGISVVSVPVGDRNVTEAIEKDSLSLGGEASGHIIFRSFAATGDGLLTALQTLAALRESGGRLSVLRKGFEAVPQVLENLEVLERVPLEGLPQLKTLIGRYERQLEGEGRIFVRYSGTEPLLRIMIEGPSQARIKAMARDIARAYLAETGQSRRV